MSDEYKSRQERKKAQNRGKNGKPPKNGGKKKRSIWKKIFITMAILIGLAIIGGGITVASIISGAPDIDEERLTLPQSLQIFDMNDEQVYTLASGEKRINANIDEMPDHLKNAFIAVEDHRFYDHFGVDLRRLGGAVVANFREGFGAEGASTITQQLVKNLFLSNEKALTRKIQEQYLAIQLERRYTKDEILEMYLNQINLGPSAGYGVQLAAEKYFNKEDLNDLTVADAAVLAAIPQRPSYFDPHRNPENNEKRRNVVIDRMEREGFITAAEAEEARNTPIEEQLDYVEGEDTEYLTFYDEVLTELEEMSDLSTNDIYNSGLKVYTTLDMDAQEHVDHVMKSGEYADLVFPESEDFRAGVTLLETQTGAIRAMGNGIDENDPRVENYATIRRQQGSAMKPLLSYAPGINDQQWSTAKIFVDEEYHYQSEAEKEVRNYDRTHKGPMTMRQALAESRNVPAVKAINEEGVDNAFAFLDKMFVVNDNERYESAALGGAEVSTKEMAGAYAAFGNNGEYHEPYTIRKIVFPDGRELNTEPEPTQVMEDYTGYMITDMLKTVVTSGTGTEAQIPGVPIAGKTGTTNYVPETMQKYNIPSGGFPASSFTGYSTNYTASVWIGFSQNGEGNYLTSNHSKTAQRMFKHIMTEVHQGIDTPDFVKPDSVVEMRVERSTGKLPSAGTPSSEIVTELFVKGTGPTQVSQEFASISDPTNVSYSYNEESNSVTFSWSYPGDEVDNVKFSTSVSSGSLNVDEGSMKAVLTGVTPGESYTFTVRAQATDGTGLRSAAVSVTATIPGGTEEEEEEEPEEEEEEPVEEEEEPNDGEETPPDEDESNDDENNNDENDGSDSDSDSDSDADTDPADGGNDNDAGNGDGTDNGGDGDSSPGSDNGNNDNGNSGGNGNDNTNGGENTNNNGGNETPPSNEPDDSSDGSSSTQGDSSSEE
ncbi:PBP1A family penicillin-binding protein [Alkalihalobacillus clausii]|uniref:penicillin-binding protein 1A n=1 Tax=Shouchella clausii TaxID=79880 RepID=UPI00203EF3C1|nr:penicillin-binding protein 1A [Shouchella clausii]MCM3549429.1 PBP1A family penicillin-binding protein [Shouchella clausii]